MAWLQLRPTFVIPVRDNRLEAIAKLEQEFAHSKKHGAFLMHGEYGELHLPAEEHRLWSPHLSFYISDQSGHCLIHGRFAPRMEVWTFVWVVYLAMSFTAFYGLALAYSQYMLGQTMWGTWLALLSMLSIVVLYAIANIGQQLSSDQMHALRVRLDSLLMSAGVQLESTSEVVIAS